VNSDQRIGELIERLHRLRGEVRDIEQLLASLGLEVPGLMDPVRLVELVERLEQIRQAERVYHALARVDFNDDYYVFIRAIDGDTIVVEPPQELRRWIKDVHVRLYGLETPELWEELGPQYQRHLEELCSVDGRGRLMIVWERERLGTNYEGFPLTSFERGIGHVFFRGPEGRFLYVNGLMHLLKYSSVERAGKNLLRGRSRLRDTDVRLPWRDRCATPLEVPEACSDTFRMVAGLGPPICLLTYPRLPSLDPRDPSFHEKIAAVIREAWSFSCPFQGGRRQHDEALMEDTKSLRVSPFDVPLTLTSMWALEQQKRTA